MNFWLYPSAADFSDGLTQAAYAMPFPTWRMMDVGGANNSDDVTESDLSRADWRYVGGAWNARQRVPIARLVAICSAFNKSGWFCVPHGLNETALKAWCRIVLDGSTQRPIIEISNEVWNAQFEQHHYAESRGGWVAWLAQRARRVRALVGDRADVVVGGQFWSVDRTLPLFDACAGVVDSVAVAPYFGRKGQDGTEIKREIEQEISPLIREYVALATDRNMRIYAYEGGYHGKDLKFAHSAECGQMDYLLWSSWRREGGGVWCPYALATSGNEVYGHLYLENGIYKPLPRYDGVLAAMRG